MLEQKIPIPVFMLKEGDILTFDIYVYINNHFILYKKKDDTINYDLISKAKDKSIFYILKSQLPSYQFLVRQHLDDPIEIDKIETEILKMSSGVILEEIFTPNLKTTHESFEKSKIIVDTLINRITKNPRSMDNILSLIKHDYYTFNHCLNVSAYIISFANTLMRERYLTYNIKTIEDIGLAGLLHDIGKKEIPEDIINKKDPLTNEEWLLIKKHPELGHKILTELKTCSKILLEGVLYHHEQIDGTGYPKKIKGGQIPLCAKMITICDVFDAVTSKRSYATPMNPKDALTLMKQDMPGKFDFELLLIFEQKVFPLLEPSVLKFQASLID